MRREVGRLVGTLDCFFMARVLLAVLLFVFGARASAQDASPLIPAKDHDAVMKQFNAALGVECTYCHIQDNWKDASKPPWTVARNMYRMVASLNGESLANTKGVRCLTCHGGQSKPLRLASAAWMSVRDKWPASLASADDGVKVTMSVYSASLGVDCAFCHDPAKWSDPSKPAHEMARRMAAMFDVFPKFMPEGARTQCYMCHKGARSPR